MDATQPAHATGPASTPADGGGGGGDGGGGSASATAGAFLRDGFVKVEGAVDWATAGECAALLWQETGSHLDVPPVLAPYGEQGASILRIAPAVEEATAHRPVVPATGRPGDVYLCHPFLVHAAQPHHGRRPRFLAQPPLCPAVPLETERADGAYSPVELAIRQGLSGAGGAARIG